MKRTPRVRFVLRRSRRAGLLIALLALITAALPWVLPWPWWGAVLVDVAVGGWAWIALRRHAWRTASQAVTELILGADRRLSVRCAGDSENAEPQSGEVLDASHVGDFFVSIVWRADASAGGLKALLGPVRRTLWILPDMLEPEDDAQGDAWRRLRILLLHGYPAAGNVDSGNLR